MTKPFKVKDAHGLRDHTGQFSLSGKPAPGKLPEVIEEKSEPGLPAKVERDPITCVVDPAPVPQPAPPAERVERKPFRLG